MLLSAHDITLLSILHGLNLMGWKCYYDQWKRGEWIENGINGCLGHPVFSSNILFELYKEDNGAQTVRMLYND